MQGRLFDRGIEELAVKLLGKAQVERVKQASPDAAKSGASKESMN